MRRRGMMGTSPIGALLSGALAGVVGSLAQNLFFKATAKVAPAPPEGAFEPPDPRQEEEPPTQTVARRVVEDVAQRRLEQPRRGGALVHYAFGASWGGLYGLLAASSRSIDTLPGALAFGAGVWAVSDNLILPAFRLGAWPRAYPPRNHAYAVAAHLVYGAATFGATRALRPGTWAPVVAALDATWRTRRLPAPARRPARAALTALHHARARVASVAAELR